MECTSIMSNCKSESICDSNSLKDFDDSKEAEGVWSPDIEKSFHEALLLYPPCGRRKIVLSEEGKMYGRNELIARYIKLQTGKTRSRKQVSSHIQVLARRKAKEIQAHIQERQGREQARQTLAAMSSAQIVSADLRLQDRISSAAAAVSHLVGPSSNGANGADSLSQNLSQFASMSSAIHHHHQQQQQQQHMHNQAVQQQHQALMHSVPPQMHHPQQQLHHLTTSCTSTSTTNNNSPTDTTSPPNTAAPTPAAHSYNTLLRNSHLFTTYQQQQQQQQQQQHQQQQQLGLYPSPDRQHLLSHISSQHLPPHHPHVHPPPPHSHLPPLQQQISRDSSMSDLSVTHHSEPSPTVAPFAGRTISTRKLRVVEISVFLEYINITTQKSPVIWRHMFAHLLTTSKNTCSTPLETIDVTQILDKYPETNGLKEHFESGTQDAFFMVKFWIDVRLELTSKSDHCSTIIFEGVSNIPIKLSTKLCSFGKEVLERIEEKHPVMDNGVYTYKFENVTMCEYMRKFMVKLCELNDYTLMNKVLENFTILQTVTNAFTGELLLCIAFAMEVSQLGGSQYNIYKLVQPPSSSSFGGLEPTLSPSPTAVCVSEQLSVSDSYS